MRNVWFRYYSDKLIEHARAHGLKSSTALVGKNLIWPICEWLIRRRIRAHHRFDEKYGLDTQMPISAADLELSAPVGKFARRYEGTPIRLIQQIIRRLKTDLRRFTFLDLGSGKGRVLLIASQYPFRAVMGVELSEALHNIAQTNIKRFVDLGFTKSYPTSLHMDAGAFDFTSNGHVIVFCNNPFGASVMLRVLDNLQLAVARTQHQAILIYLTPIPQEIVQKLCEFSLIAHGNYLSDYGGFQKYFIYRIN